MHHVAGSHYILKLEGHPELRVTLSWHGRDLKKKTVISVIHQAGLTVEQFLELL